MASFDISEASGEGYALLWEERSYLFRLAAVPIFIKILCFLVLAGFGWEQDFIKQALVLLPSYFADGWMVSHLVRLIVYDQRWPFMPSGDPEKDVARLQERASGIMGGTLVFAVIEYLVTGFVGFLYMYGQNAPLEDPGNPLLVTSLGILGIIAVFWGFRLLWLYIPAAAGYSLRKFLNEIKGYETSIYMIGVWLICMVPVFLLFRFLISMVVAPYGGTLENIPALPDVGVTVLIILMDTILALLTTAGMTYGIMDIFTPKTKKAHKK